MINEHNDINDLITKHLVRETSPDEEKELSMWINQNEANRRHYEDLKKTFQLTEQYFAVPAGEKLDINLNEEWAHFTAKIGAGKTPRHLSTGQFWLRIAASVLLLMVVATLLYHYGAPNTTTYQTAGNKESVILPDGTQVTLNRITSLSYAKTFGQGSRTVTLKGEAFFEVKADPERPFIILADEAKVQVLGTSFSVNAYDSIHQVEVIVQTGIVSLRGKEGRDQVQLAAGQKGIYSKTNEKLTSTTNNDPNFLSWNTQRIVFVENDLRTVIETLEKTYHVDITISADVPASCLVTVTFDKQSLESVLRVLESTLNLKYTINGNKVEITEAGC